MISQEAAERFADEWMGAWNTHDLERILSHYTEEIEFHSPFVSRLLNQAAGALQGKTALRGYFSTALAAYPELSFELIQVLCGANSVVLYYRSVRQLYAAEVMEFNADGKVRRVLAHYTAGGSGGL